MEFTRHGLSHNVAVNVEKISPQGTATPYAAGVKEKITLDDTLPGRHVTLFRFEQSAREEER